MSDLISRKEIIDRLERVIQNGVPSEDGMHPISAEAVMEVVKEQLGTNLAEVGTDLATKRAVKGFPIDADLLMLKVEEEYGFRARDRLYEIIRYMPKYELPSAQPEPLKIDLSGYSKEDWERFRKEWANIPMTVLPKQRTGKWIKLDMHRGMADHKCTACEQECYVPTCMGEPMYAFCPNCGAEMEVNHEGN